MIDLGLIEKRLNSDADYRARFFKDPVAVLLTEGLSIPFEKQIKLRQRVAQITESRAQVPGSRFSGFVLLFDVF